MEVENFAEVNLTHLFAADVILPVQVIHALPDRWLQRLCLAILEDALNCLEIRAVRGGHIARARYRNEAWAWLMSDADYCFSFTTVCSVLQLNAEAIRKQLRQAATPGRVSQAGVSRQLRQPLSRAPSVRSARMKR